MRASLAAEKFAQSVEHSVLIECLEKAGVTLVISPCRDGVNINYGSSKIGTEYSTAVRKEDLTRWLWRNLTPYLKQTVGKKRRQTYRGGK